MTETLTDKQKIQAWIMAGETQTKAAQLSKYNHQKFRWQNLVPPLIAVEIELKKDKERKIAAATSTFLFLDSQLHQCIRALRISEDDIMADIAKVNTLSLDYTEYDAFVINAMAACTEYMRVCIEFGATETRYTMIELISNDAWYEFIKAASKAFSNPTEDNVKDVYIKNRDICNKNHKYYSDYPFLFELCGLVLQQLMSYILLNEENKTWVLTLTKIQIKH